MRSEKNINYNRYNYYNSYNGGAGVTTTIAVSEETRDMLKKFGEKGETYDEIIRKAFEIAKMELFFDRQDAILKKGEFVPLDEL